MNAFINGALSALTRCLNLIAILDPNGEDQNMVDMKNQILIYIKMYKQIAVLREENPVKDPTWENIKKASDLSEEQLDFLEGLIAKA